MDIAIGGIVGITILVVLFYLFVNKWLALLALVMGLAVAFIVRIAENFTNLMEGFFDALIKLLK